jgi:hypothetical protein
LACDPLWACFVTNTISCIREGWVVSSFPRPKGLADAKDGLNLTAAERAEELRERERERDFSK